MAIWRGTGGSGESTNDSTINAATALANQAAASATAAAASETAAEAAQTAAEQAETNAETAETNAETAATNAATSATSAASSATAAASSAAEAAVFDPTLYLTKSGNLSGLESSSTSRTNLGLGTIATQDASSVAISGGTISGITDLAVADGGTGASTATDARTNLGLGTLATQAASAVSITGGSITGITDLAVADGGTGASTAADARTNLGLAAIAASGSASDLSTGTVGTARLGSGTASSSTYLRGDQTWATVSGGVTSITAGNGLTGGTITSSGTIALDFYTGSSETNTSFPIGSYLQSLYNFQVGSSLNSSVTVRLYYNGGQYGGYAVNAASGTILSGTWRNRGGVFADCPSGYRPYAVMVQRTA